MNALSGLAQAIKREWSAFTSKRLSDQFLSIVQFSLLAVGLFFIYVVLPLIFMDNTEAHRQFMTACLKDMPEYRCVAMWRGH